LTYRSPSVNLIFSPLLVQRETGPSTFRKDYHVTVIASHSVQKTLPDF
jgi:hypothetical protein